MKIYYPRPVILSEILRTRSMQRTRVAQLKSERLARMQRRIKAHTKSPKTFKKIAEFQAHVIRAVPDYHGRLVLVPNSSIAQPVCECHLDVPKINLTKVLKYPSN